MINGIINSILWSTSGGGATDNFVAFPSIPAISDSILLDPSMGSAISSAEMAGFTMGLVPDTWSNLLRSQGLDGVIFRPNRTDGEYAVVDCTAVGSIPAMIGQTGSPVSTNIEYYNLILLANTGLSSALGIKWVGDAGGSNFKAQNIRIVQPQSPGVQFNGDGDAGTYGTIDLSFIYVYGQTGLAPGEFTEGLYGGDTTTTTGVYGIIDTYLISHGFATNTAGDGAQFNSIEHLTASHLTVIDVAYNNVSGQKSLLQLQNIGDGGLVENCIFWNAPRAFTIGARDITIRNCVFYSDEEGFYQDVETQSGYEFPLSTAGGTVRFENCHFYSSGSRAYAVEINENKANFIFTNCVIGTNITDLYDDARVDTSTYSILELNTTSQATPTAPTVNKTYTVLNSGTVTGYFRTLGMGLRNQSVVNNYPTITSFAPTSQEETLDVVITGTNFTDTTVVSFGGVAASSFTVDSSTQITATVATGSSSGAIIVTTPSGSTGSFGFIFIPPVAPFNPFTDIAGWVAAFDPTDYNGSTGAWNNQGTGADAAQGGATIFPTKLSSLSTQSGFGLEFVNASGTGLQYATGNVTEPFETWVEIITPASFSGTQRIYANGNATRLTVNGSGQVSVGGNGDVSTGLTLSTSTRYVLRIVNNGASSSITANNGTPLTFTITPQAGSSTPKLGHAYSAGSGHWTGTMGAFFQKSTVLSSGEITDMWTYFGY